MAFNRSVRALVLQASGYDHLNLLSQAQVEFKLARSCIERGTQSAGDFEHGLRTFVESGVRAHKVSRSISQGHTAARALGDSFHACSDARIDHQGTVQTQGALAPWASLKQWGAVPQTLRHPRETPLPAQVRDLIVLETSRAPSRSWMIVLDEQATAGTPADGS